jgi:xanthine dehydrogenase accessory factor
MRETVSLASFCRYERVMEDAIRTALEWVSAGKRVAIATVTATWGSAPRPRGSQMAVREDGLFVGSVSGGCVEARVVEAAISVIENGDACELSFGVSNEEAWDVGLACGGTVKIHVELADRERLESISKAQDPPLRLVIVGAVHVAAPLVEMGRLLGYDVVVIDPREAFARAERWPGARVVCAWPDEAFSSIEIDHRTAIVALTHDPKIDDPALEVALRSAAFYVGALGSTKTHAARLDRLGRRGFSDAELTRIHGPVGLRIGAKTVSEIAVSIVAQMTEVLRA